MFGKRTGQPGVAPPPPRPAPAAAPVAAEPVSVFRTEGAPLAPTQTAAPAYAFADDDFLLREELRAEAARAG